MIDIKNRCIWLDEVKVEFIDIHYIDALNFHIDYNDFGEKVSFLELSVLLDKGIKTRLALTLRFVNVSDLKLQRFGGSLVSISGFDILDMKESGWSDEVRYHIVDYEDGMIDFYCAEIIVIE